MKHLALLMLLLNVQAQACTWATGYFHQVTHLRGTVVGTDSIRDLRALFRWSRRMFVRDNMELKLYEYRDPRQMSDRHPVRRVVTAGDGHFDFGVLPVGHYTLDVGHSLFDVQVVSLPRKTRAVIIDISPVTPDCKGGHEFEAISE